MQADTVTMVDFEAEVGLREVVFSGRYESFLPYSAPSGVGKGRFERGV